MEELLKPEECIPKINGFNNYLRSNGCSIRYSTLLVNVIKRYYLMYGKFDIEYINKFLMIMVESNNRSYYSKYAFKNFLSYIDRSDLSTKLIKVKKLPNKTSGNLYPQKKLKEVIKNMHTEKFKLIAQIQFDTGWRSFEVVSLMRANIKYDKDGDLSLYVIGKGGKEKTGFVSKGTEKFLKYWMNKTLGDFLFLTSNSRNLENAIDTMTRYYRKSLMKAAMNTFGVSKLRTHDFRRNVAVDAYNRTHDLLLVQKLLDHSSIAQTEKYIKDIAIDKKKILREIRR